MIKPTELRIGNWVSGSDREDINLYQVVKIDDIDFIDLDSGDEYNVIGKTEGGKHQYFDIKPSGIPLTEEWLKKFGFEYCDGLWIKNDLSTGLNQKDLYGDGLKWYYTIGHIVIETTYVHQLQNLFFALMGKELELKEN